MKVTKYFRKITDSIESHEENLETLESDKNNKLQGLKHVQKIFNETRDIHETNRITLKRLQSSGTLDIAVRSHLMMSF